MVNRGASFGCVTCKQRRVKCDETKPKCGQCTRLGRECGYGKKAAPVRFKDETSRFSGKSSKSAERASNKGQNGVKTATTPMTKTDKSPSSSPSPSPASAEGYTILPYLPPRQQDLAVPFFLTYVTNVGRSLESTRGFLEFVQPVLATELPNSPLNAAVTAVATEIWMLLSRQNDTRCAASATKLHNHAIVRLQSAIDHPRERTSDSAVLASLILQFHETLLAVFGQKTARGAHRNGALALLLNRNGNTKGSKYHANLFANVLHSKVSYCIRQREPLPLSEVSWLEDQVIPNMVINPSCLLDIIGISVANIQHEFWEFLKGPDEGLPPIDLAQRIQNAEAELQGWVKVIPQHWHPVTLQGSDSLDASIPTFQGTCDVYPSLQIASIWNAWRIYRLILIQIRRELPYLLGPEHCLNNNAQVDQNGNFVIDDDLGAHETEEFVDGLCRSVPFYLGNCEQPPTVYDLDSSKVVLPSCHDLPRNSQPFIRYDASQDSVSRMDHCRHVILQGPVYMMSVLSLIIGLFKEESRLPSTQILNQDQQEWISEQFLRSLYLLRRVPDATWKSASRKRAAKADKSLLPQRPAPEVSQAEGLASGVKKGLWTMNIL